MQKGFAPILIIVGVVIILAISGAYYLGTKNSPINQPQNSGTASISPQPTSINEIAGWKTYTNAEGNYSFQYPSDWVVEIYKEKYPNNAQYDKAYILFQSRATTAKEKADDAPGMPMDMATGAVRVITTNSMRGTQYSKISEQEFFNISNIFWLRGDVGGGGPGATYSIPQEVKIAGKRAIKQEYHPTTYYEWVGPNQISTNYYIWLGNSDNEVVEVSLTYDTQNPDKDPLISTFNKILETFKLTN